MNTLTVAKLAIIIKYQWNYRLFQSKASLAEKELMNVDWDDLGEILSDLKLYHRNLVSKEYAQKIYADLLEVCADEITAQTLLGYAGTL